MYRDFNLLVVIMLCRFPSYMHGISQITKQ